MLDYLLARQDSDGHFKYSSSSDQTPVWVTAQALPAMAGSSFPIPPFRRGSRSRSRRRAHPKKPRRDR